jgi:two-component system chemotaxis response regulator CheB
MISGYAADGVDITLECLRLGAADFVAKPSGSFSIDMDKIADLLREKVKAAATVDIPQPVPPQPSTPKMLRYSKTGGVVVVGASTGGPAALEAILPQLPANFPYPVVIVQHLPKEFTGSFVARLQKTCQLQVARADNNTRLSAGTMYIVPGGTTTTVSERQGTPFFAVVTNVADIQTPSIDAVMVSIADVYGVKTVGVILTGMGSDGAAGMARIKQTGGTTIAQDRATSIVYGMNKEIVERGLADSVVPLDAVVDTLNELLQ